MPIPLYNTDVQKIVDRTPKTVLLDTDVFVVADEDGTLAPITKPNVKNTLGISENESDIIALDTNKADKDTGAIEGNFASFDAFGNPVDSGKKDADYEDADVTILKQSNIINALDSTSTTAPLSANQGKVLKDAQDLIKGTGWTDENLVDHEVRLQRLEFMPHVSSWADVQSIVRDGNASAYFPVGTQFNALWNGVERTLEVIGIDHDTPTDTSYTHSLTLQFKDIPTTGRISGPEAMYNAVTELAAGTHIFTTNSLQYTFTSMQAVPAGGVIYIKTRSEYVPLTLTIYAADRKTVIEDDIAVTATTGIDTITPINNYIRMRYGSNLYKISAIRQWLNSEDATFVWQPLGLYDMPSSYETAGFINLLDADLQAVIGAVDKQVARATYDDGGQDTFSDKVFLLSRKEIFGDDEGAVTGEVVYPFWDGSSNEDRIKGSPSSWRLRSPTVSSTTRTRYVNTSGALSDSNALSSIGLAPACVIY